MGLANEQVILRNLKKNRYPVNLVMRQHVKTIVVVTGDLISHAPMLNESYWLKYFSEATEKGMFYLVFFKPTARKKK